MDGMNELLWFLMLMVNFVAILLCYRFLGKTGLFVWVAIAAIIANIQVVKTIELFGLTATLGNIVYATSFLVTDILSENYGARSARRAVIFGFFSLIVATVLMNLALLFVPDVSDTAHDHLVSVFRVLPRISAASLVAYGISQSHDVWAYGVWKRLLPATKQIWIRNNMSTIVSQLIDSVRFTAVAFLGVFPWSVLWQIAVTTYLMKVIVAILDTPLVYIARHWYDKGVVKSEDWTRSGE